MRFVARASCRYNDSGKGASAPFFAFPGVFVGSVVYCVRRLRQAGEGFAQKLRSLRFAFPAQFY